MSTRSIIAGSAAFILFSLFQPFAIIPAQPLAAPANPAATPADRLSEPWWAQRHNSILKSAASHTDAEVVFVGDAMFNNSENTTPSSEDLQSIWKQFYQPRRALNLGFSGDTTSNVLWRIDHGELDGLDPRVVVVLVGSANTASANQTALQTVDGIDAVVGDITRRLPATRILLLGILPSGISDQKTARDQEVNSRLGDLFAGDPRVLYLDVGAIFYDRSSLNTAMFYDTQSEAKPLQPNSFGQRRLAEAIEPALSNLLRDTSRLTSPSPDILAQQVSAQQVSAPR
jgi:lysophospholipase L1-like esterase